MMGASQEITDAGLEYRLVFVARNVLRDLAAAALGVGHFSKHPAARAGDAFDGGERTVRVDRDVHRGCAVGIAILGGDLAAGGECADHVGGGVEFSFAVGNRDVVGVA